MRREDDRANNGSLVLASGNFSITSERLDTNFGTVVNKVGRTTGWTQGQVSNSCVTTNVSGTSIAQICQTFVQAGVGGGDSGSPVFIITSGDNVALAGILWGGSGSSLFVFSPLRNIERELGGLTTRSESGSRVRLDVCSRQLSGRSVARRFRGLQPLIPCASRLWRASVKVAQGEPVPVNLRLTNTTDRAITVYLQGRPPAFDIVMKNESGAVVWRRLEGQTIPAILGVHTLEPGRALEFSDTWNQRNLGGAPGRPWPLHHDRRVADRRAGPANHSPQTDPHHRPALLTLRRGIEPRSGGVSGVILLTRLQVCARVALSSHYAPTGSVPPSPPLAFPRAPVLSCPPFQ